MTIYGGKTRAINVKDVFVVITDILESNTTMERCATIASKISIARYVARYTQSVTKHVRVGQAAANAVLWYVRSTCTVGCALIAPKSNKKKKKTTTIHFRRNPKQKKNQSRRTLRVSGRPAT